MEAALKKRGMKTLSEWNDLYTDLPSTQIKVNVKDRSLIQTEDAERCVVKPDGMQDKITAACSEFGGRSFVRPSGTEDIVRVYAEAKTKADAEGLAASVREIVISMMT